MEKTSKQYTNYNAVSKNESVILGMIKTRDLTVFGIQELRTLTKWSDNRINNTLSSLEKKRLLVRIKRDHYVLEDLSNVRSFEIATETVKPSYISFWTALSYYGLTEQQVNQIQLVSTKQYKDARVGPYTFSITTFKPNIFYGYKRTEGFVIAEMEKALVDSLYLPEKCGGLNEFVKCLVNSLKKLNTTKLIRYAIGFNNRSLVSRLGYILEILELECKVVDRLLPYRSNSYIKLSVIGERIRSYNNKWKIMVNHEFEQEEII